MWESIKSDPILKGVAIVLLSVIILGFVFMLIGGLTGNGITHGVYGNHMTVSTMNGLSISGILVFLIKLLLIVSIISMVVGVFMFVKNNYSKQITQKIEAFKVTDKSSTACTNCSTKVSGRFKFCPICGAKLKPECAACGTELKAEWKCCPNCGTEKSGAEKI